MSPHEKLLEEIAAARSRFGDPWWRDLSYRLGHEVWNHTYRLKPDNDQYAMNFALQVEAANGRIASFAEMGGAFAATDVRTTVHATALGRWVDGGCRILTTDAKYFSAMAHTTIFQEAVEELRIPWPAFVVEWPADLCVAPDGFVYDTALFAQLTDVRWMLPNGEMRSTVSYMVINNKRAFAGPSLTRVYPGTLAEMLFQGRLAETLNDDNDLPRNDGDCQIQEMAAKACAGLLYTMQHTNNWRPSRFASPVQRGKLRSAPPPHRVISIGRPLELDAASAVRDRAAGRATSAPSVQTLVRGHVKRQVVGLGGRGRKVIWIEPYWRGPEDAPILARPYKVGT